MVKKKNLFWMNLYQAFTKTSADGEKKTNSPPVTASLRNLTVCAASTLLERFDRTMEKMNRNWLVDSMTALRNQGFNAKHFVDMVLRKGDPRPLTGQQKLTFLTFGSPALRYLLHQLHTYVLPAQHGEKPRKLLLTEDIPLSAEWWDIVKDREAAETLDINRPGVNAFDLYKIEDAETYGDVKSFECQQGEVRVSRAEIMTGFKESTHSKFKRRGLEPGYIGFSKNDGRFGKSEAW